MKKVIIIISIIVVITVSVLVLRSTVYELTDEDIDNIKEDFEQILLANPEYKDSVKNIPALYSEYEMDDCVHGVHDIKIDVKIEKVQHIMKRATIYFRYDKTCYSDTVLDYKDDNLLCGTWDTLKEVVLEKQNGKWIMIKANEYFDKISEPNL